MRTTVLNHMHTQHPEAQAEFERLAKVEAELSRLKAAAAEPDLEPKRQRMSAPLEVRDFDAELAEVRALMDVQREVIASGWVRLVVSSLKRSEYRRLLIENPPLDTDAGPEYSREAGYGDSFIDALIKACVVQTLAHELNGGGPVENDLDEWLDDMTDGQAMDLFRRCLKLNQDPNPAPPLPR